MSDTMLLGVLRMPYNIALDTEIGRIQYYQRGLQAADEIEQLRAENEKLRNERDTLRKIILDAAYDAEWCDKEIHLTDSDECYQNWRLVVYLPVPCNVTDKEIESALDRAVANNSKL